MYSCTGTIGQPASLKKHCGKFCATIDGSLGEARCVGLRLPTTNELAARASEGSTTECTCPIFSLSNWRNFPQGICGSDSGVLSGACDPGAIYTCPFPGTGTDPASMVKHCGAHEVCKYFDPGVGLFPFAIPECNNTELPARGTED